MSSESPIPLSPNLPSAVDVRRWEVECTQIDDLIAGLEKRKAAYQSLIYGAHQLWEALGIPPHSGTATSEVETSKHDDDIGDATVAPPTRRPSSFRKDRGISWTSALSAIIQQFPQGISHKDLKAEYLKSPALEVLGTSDKSFYGATFKLANRGEIIKYKGHLFIPAHYKQFLLDLKAGQVADLVEPAAGGHSPFGDAIKEFLEQAPSGAKSSEIIADLRKHPEFVDTMERHKTHVYNVLSRLVDQGDLVKGGGLYFRSPQAANKPRGMTG